jgi:hypothetical protein
MEENEGEEEKEKIAVISIYFDVVLKKYAWLSRRRHAFYVKICRNVQLVSCN